MRNFLRNILSLLIIFPFLTVSEPAFGLKRLIEILEVGVTDSSDVVVASGTATFYDAGTSNLRTVYSDYALTTPLANPATLDAAGRLVAYSDRRIKILLKNSAGTTIRTVDNVGTADSDIAASAVSGGLTTTIPPGALMAYGGAAAPTGWLLCDGTTVSQADYAALYTALGTTFNTGGEAAGTFRLPGTARKTLVGAGGAGTATLGNAVGNTGGEESHTMTTGEMVAHTHAAGTLVNAAESSHTHGVGSYAAANESAHTHTFTQTTSMNSPAVLTANAAGPFGALAGGATYANETHTHDFSGTTAGGSAHTHTLSGTSAAGSSHNHTISGSTASTGSTTAFNVIQPSLVVNYIIKY